MADHVCPPWVGRLLLNPLRMLVENPNKIFAPFVKEGMVVLEPGCAMGFFTLPLARMVGPEGKVVAVDVAYRTVVVDVTTAKGELTVGVTLASSVAPRVDGQTIPLRDVAVGERAVLKYTRENGSLVGLEMRVRR